MTTITALPDAPSRTDPATFSDKSDALLGALATFVTETNLVAGECVSNTAAAAASVVDAAAEVALAAAQVALATTQADNAATSATASAQSALVAGAVVWVSGTTYAIGDTRYSPINFQTYRRTTSGGGTTDPSLDSANWTKALAPGVTSVTTATGMTTLTSTGTLLKITPAAYGVAVTLPDATTCSVGGPLHIIDNLGAYPVRVLNSSGTLLGFIFAGVVSHVSLIDNSMAAGVWAVENSELVGASAQLLTANMAFIDACIDIGSSQEVLIGRGVSSANCYGVVYNRSTNTFGSVTLIRTATFASERIAACLSGTNQVLVCSVATAATTFEAVVLSISGTTITVNTAATATLSANINAFSYGKGLIAVGSSFVCSYTVVTPASQIRALSISGTTVTIGAAEVVPGTDTLGLIAIGDSPHVISVSTATTHLYTKPYLVSGSTLTAGTGTDTNSGTMTLNKLAALGTRWYVGYNDGGSTVKGGVVSLDATGNGTTTISTATLMSAGIIQDAIIVGSNKVLVLNNQSSNNANILTDSAGTASAGTAITCITSAMTPCSPLFIDGTTVYIAGLGNGLTHLGVVIDCSGSSPVSTFGRSLLLDNTMAATSSASVSNQALSKAAAKLHGTNFMQALNNASTATIALGLRVSNGEFVFKPTTSFLQFSYNCYRGKSDSERWVTNQTTVITKLECVA